MLHGPDEGGGVGGVGTGVEGCQKVGGGIFHFFLGLFVFQKKFRV